MQTRIIEANEEIYRRFFSPEADYIKFYADEMRSIDNDCGYFLVDSVGRIESIVKKIYEQYKGKVIVLEVNENLKRSNVWLEWRTEGQVFSRVLGHKKSYKFHLSIPPILICDGNICKHIEVENLYPSFEIFVDFIDIYVEKERRHIRKFFNNKGKIKIFLVIEDTHTLERKIYEIGEVEVTWISHHEIDRLARKKLHRIRNMIKQLRERGERKGLRKLQEKLEKYLKMTHKQWIGGLRIRGRIGDLDISKVMLKPRRSRKKVNLLAPTAVKSSGVDSVRFSIRIVEKDELKDILRDAKLVHSFVVRDRATLYGFYGKINHEIRISGIPKRKIKVHAMVQVRNWKYNLKVNKHPVKVYEYVLEKLKGLQYIRKKIWVIEPIDNVARFILKNRDHAGEAIDRILVQLEKGEYLVFEHEL